MPQKIQVGNDILEFPDDMPDNEIKVAIDREYGAPEMEQPKPKRQIGKLESAITGFGQGASANFGDEIIAGLSTPAIYGGSRLAEKLGFDTRGLADKSLKEIYRAEQLKNQSEVKETQEANPKSYLGGDVAGSIATAVKAAPTAVSKATTDFLRSGPLWARMGKGAIVGSGSGAVYGAGAADSDKIAEGALEGGKYGAATGAAFPLVSSAVRSVVAPKTSDLAQRAVDLNIPLRVDQIAPSRFKNTLQKVSQELPFSGVTAFEEGQKKAFNKALAKTIGQNSDDLSPETINKFKIDASKKFEDILGDANIRIDESDILRINGVRDEAANSLGNDLLAIVNRNVDNVLSDVRSGNISGKKLSSIRAQLLDRATKSQGESKHFIGNIVDAIDEIAQKNISPAKNEGLKAARQEWRNFKTMEPLLEKSTDGTVNPTQLLNRVGASKYVKASGSSVGRDDLIDLARIGKELLTKKSGSDTFQKTALGAGAVGALLDPGTGLLIGSGLLANRGLQSLNSNQALVKALARQNKSSRYPMLLPTLSGAVATQ